MKTVIEMAKEAGFACESNGEIYIDDRDGVCTKNLNSFAELVRADERGRMCQQPKECSSEKSTSNETNRSAVLGEGKQAN